MYSFVSRPHSYVHRLCIVYDQTQYLPFKPEETIA